MCSTPFGITDARPAAWPVLNAFRHHGGRHVNGGTMAAAGSAQRLSASRRASQPGFVERTFFASSAQRLSASRRASLKSGSRWQSAVASCSTPFGITEGVTRGRALRAGCAWTVLNAFRHHGGRHLGPLDALLGRGECSTPFGITEGVTRQRCPVRRRATCAQRLSASRRASPVRTGVDGDRRSAQRLSASRRASHITAEVTTSPLRRQVLNAFRHHGGRHSVAACGAGAQRLSASRRAPHQGGRRATLRRSCAQRLSASRRASRLEDRPVHRAIRCSTPFGITEGVTYPIRRERLKLGKRHVLNAFRHHGGRHKVV